MILIITHKEDYTADYVIDKLNKFNLPYFRFNCEDYLSYNITLRFGKYNECSINQINNFTSVWYRRTKLPQIKSRNKSELIYLLGEMDTFIHNLFGIIKAKWLSDPVAVANAENKLLQLSLGKEIGFNVPDTLLTTNKQELESFFRKNKFTILKPISSGRVDYEDNTSKLIFTNIINDDVINNINSMELTPAIYQEYIEKDYEIRVTIVGKDCFAAKVQSQNDIESSIDWRRKKIKFERCDLPEEISKKCFSLLKRLNLSFGAFDFIKSKDGEYYFLEVNPNGQWVWIEKDTGQPIADSIINYLSC